jgi:pimeloyl-ACP methyl ester carboxylesterase
MSVEFVVSADGTAIACEAVGEGAPLVLVGGAFCDRHARASGTPLAALLAGRFRVLSYDRRGRGQSGDATPFAVERELDDLAAVVALAGPGASVFGNSSGALLALAAAAAGIPVKKLALFEPPVILDTTRAASLEPLARELARLAAEGERGAAAERFLTELVQVPPPAVAHMRKAPFWSGLEALAHTLSYDVAITARAARYLELARSVTVPTLVLEGGASPAWMREALGTLASTLPAGHHRVLEGQTHDVDTAVLASALAEFLGD